MYSTSTDQRNVNYNKVLLLPDFTKIKKIVLKNQNDE